MFSQACVKNSVQGWACMHPRTLMPPRGYYEMRSMSGRYAILLECILVSMSILFYKKGSVHFYKKKDEAVGSDLIAVILQGWPMLILILLGAGYSGIIIWLLVRLFIF